MDITENFVALRGRVASAAQVSNRAATSVTIVAVSKTHPIEAIRAAHAAGVRDFGENYVQEAVAKVTQLRNGVAWHFIGAIQANKTRAIAENFDWVQTVAGVRVAERLAAQRPYYAGDLQVCIQVQPEPATLRGGVAAAGLADLAACITALPRLRLRGLMFMPAASLPADALRAEFRRVRHAFESLRAAGYEVDTLSMGMSEDLEIAIEEGSTMVRVGTALFGARNG